MDRYRPRYEADAGPPASPAGGPNAMYQFQGSQWQGRGGPPRGGDFTFRQGRPRVSDRPLLAGLRGASPDPVFRGADTVEKFRQVDDLTDSDEEDMDFSQSDDDEEQRPSKRLRSGPSWSNPDPYTALPPVTENQKKKHDVVKLIRKSRITPPAAQPTGAAGANDEDFISFDMNDSTIEFSAAHHNEAPANAPTGPKNQQSEASTQLGKRKRDPVDDVSKLPPRANKGARLHQQGKILREWRASNPESSTPWYLPPVIPHLLPGVALHQEILDFYEWVRPHDFEQETRLDVISRLQKTFSRLEPGCQLKPFGSFAAGLYLPTGDMDLVLMAHGSFRSRRAKPLFWFIHSILDKENIAVAGSLQPIAKAKVPIIKFVDAITGLKVDLSFNNDTGIVANNTFHQWKAQYPTMPILVSVIKQFLMIRGLNDVAFGGLGGFSTICLVTSLIQHHVLPGQIPNLGDLLLKFFWFYGHILNKQEIAIRLEPPGYVRKDQYDPFLHNNDRADRLAIVDPNKADNNISGGTAEIDLIIECFRQAYNDLQAQMARREQSGQESRSLMSDLIGGDYDTYALQRERLRRIHSNKFARGNQHLPPTVSLSGPPGVALLNATAAGKKQSNVAKGPPNQANGHRRASGKDVTFPNTTRSSQP